MWFFSFLFFYFLEITERLKLICVLFNKFATCPITGVVDFKKNMYEYHFAPIMTTGGPMGGHVAWYTKKGYEERFACKIVQCKKQDKEWKTMFCFT